MTNVPDSFTPENLSRSRIYLFCHLGPEENEGVSLPKNDISYATEYMDEYNKPLPLGVNAAIDVKRGDWIAYMGNRGQTEGPHVHLEVFEYFPDDENGLGWQQVDPLSVFSKDLYRLEYKEGDDVKSFDTYGWWSTLIGDTTLFKERKKLYNAAYGAGADVIHDLLISTILNAPGDYPEDIWLCTSKYSGGGVVNFPRIRTNNKYDTVFRPNVWEVERCPEQPKE